MLMAYICWLINAVAAVNRVMDADQRDNDDIPLWSMIFVDFMTIFDDFQYFSMIFEGFYDYFR